VPTRGIELRDESIGKTAEGDLEGPRRCRKSLGVGCARNVTLPEASTAIPLP